MKFKFPVIDSHIHVYSFEDFRQIKKAVQEGEYKQYTVLSSAFMPETAAGNLSIACIKRKYPETVYGYASFHRPETGANTSEDLLYQAQLYYEMGFDGIKMLDGKPTIRKQQGIPLDDVTYDPLFSYMEETQFPVLYHINDPIEFWDESKIPQWAYKAGYLYGKDIPSAKQIQKETLHMLEKHPNLNLTIAHFFFLSNSDDYELACAMMEKFKNLCFDVTPGWEMFEGFGRRYEQWRDFFKRYADRIVLGTDICKENWNQVQEPLKWCLESDASFEKAEIHCKGLKLTDDVLKKVYYDTYKSRIQPKTPKAIRIERLAEYLCCLEKYMNRYHLKNAERVWKEIQYYSELLKKNPEEYPI